MRIRLLNIISILLSAVAVAVIVFLLFFEKANASPLDDCKEVGETVTIFMQGRLLGVDEEQALSMYPDISEETRDMIHSLYNLYIPESIINGDPEEQTSFLKGFKKGWDNGCEKEFGGTYTKIDMYYDENGEPVWLQDTLDGNRVTDEGDILLDAPYVDLGGDETYYNTDKGEFEYYYE